MRLLIDCWNESTPKFILFDSSQPFDVTELTSAFENIVREYEQLKGSQEYQGHIEKQENKIYRHYEYLALTIALQAATLGNKKVVENIISTFKFDIKPNAESITHLIKSYENIFFIEQQNDKSDPKAAISWENMIVFIHQTLNIQIDYNCTVALYCEYEKSANRIIELRKKQNAKGN